MHFSMAMCLFHCAPNTQDKAKSQLMATDIVTETYQSKVDMKIEKQSETTVLDNVHGSV